MFSTKCLLLWVKNTDHCHIAYFLVHSLPSSLYLGRSVLKILAISGTNGSSGFGSVKSDEMDNRTETNKKRQKKVGMIKIDTLNNFTSVRQSNTAILCDSKKMESASMQTLVKNIPFLFLSFQGPAGYPWNQVPQQQILVYNIIYLKRQVDPNLFFTHESSDFNMIIVLSVWRSIV